MKKAFYNCFILDGSETMAPLPGHAVLVENDQITAILPEAEAPTEGWERIDLGGQYLLPGLINLHVHIPASGRPTRKPTDARKTVRFATANALTRKYLEHVYKSCCRTELLGGVTTLRSVGGVESYDTWIRDLINAGSFQGPRVLAGNMAISVPGGHMAGSLACEAESPQDAAGLVQTIAADRPDLIKLMVTGGVLDAVRKGEPGVLKMSPAMVKSACEQAHKLGYQVAAHVESPQGLKVALENGVDTIEHGAAPDEEILKLFRERGAALVTTLSPAVPYVFFPPSVSHADEMARFNGKVVFDGIVACARKCLANHIPVGLGTDTGCPFVTHYNMWRELYFFHKYCGVSTAFALHTATMRNAQIAGLGDVTGSIEAGKSADLILCRDNPLDDLTALADLRMVVVRGSVIKEPKVRKMKKVEWQLDLLTEALRGQTY